MTAVPCDRAVSRGWWLGIALAIALVAWAERQRCSALESGEVWSSWLFDMNVDSTPFAVLLLVLPMVWIIRQPILSHVPHWLRVLVCWLQESPRTTGELTRTGKLSPALRALVMSLGVASFAYWNCERWAATTYGPQAKVFGQLPPAFHDEFSYLFQAETLRLGTWSVPSHPTAARLFDQMHVLNEGRFASRYFPGTGLWIVSWGKLGAAPLTAYWLATALTAALVFAIGRELSNNGTGLLAGLLVALSPGIELFGNLILAHQPTLVGLGLFQWSFLRLRRIVMRSSSMTAEFAWSSQHWANAALSGVGLAFAMLCRPMTAAGIGLPFGVWIAVWLWKHARQRCGISAVIVLGYALPLLAAVGVLVSQNRAITGQAWKSPYSLYTELFTPRHMYGFNNVVRAEPLQTERVLKHYDEWAENLTPALAARNVGVRWRASWQWTLGLVALLISVPVFVSGTLAKSRRVSGTTSAEAAAIVNASDSGGWLLLLAAILSLHVAHVPYWFDGIMQWHYVFESGPLWCLVAAEATRVLWGWFQRCERHWMSVWWSAVLMVSVLVNQVAIPPFWGLSRTHAGFNELAFAKLKHEEVRSTLRQLSVGDRGVLVLVKHDPSDRHIDYVTNSPRLDGPLLIGRLPAAGMTEVETLRLASRAFPERAIFVLDIRARSLNRLR